MGKHKDRLVVAACLFVAVGSVGCFVVEDAKENNEVKDGVTNSTTSTTTTTPVPDKFPILEVNSTVRKSNSSVHNLVNELHVNGSSHNNHHDTNHHHHQWGKKNNTGGQHHHCNGSSSEHPGKLNEEEDHQDDEKVEQMLWDIFVDDDANAADEENLENESEHAYRRNENKSDDEEEEEDEEEAHDDESDSTFEEILSDSIASQDKSEHKIVKRSTGEDEQEVETGRSTKHPYHHRQKYHKKQHYKPKYHRSTSRRHTRTKTKSPNVSKYNEYMDVVLKRMNTMIKTKHMDPLMVNLFSGADAGKQQQQQNNNKPGKKPAATAGKKKNKKGYTGRKKRKGAKNRGRMEDIDRVEDVEARSGVSSESDSSSGTIELDNGHDDGVRGVGGVFIRRVGVVEEDESDEDKDELDDDGGSEDAGEEEEEDSRTNRFREMRALIVNGSMKRSTAGEESNGTDTVQPIASPPPPQNASSELGVPQETRGFGKAQQTSADSSEESSRKKQPKKPKKPSDSKKQGKPAKKSPASRKKKATRGVLKGLSSLKRYGNVDVVRQSDNVRIVRGRFLLGPVTLEIVPRGSSKKPAKNEDEDLEEEEEEERSSGKKNKKPKQDATPAQDSKVTAIARELKGIIEIRIKKNSPTTIKRLRVFPPSSVKIKSTDKIKNTSSKSTGSSVPRYNRVTPVATHRLRQIASAVVRQADVKRKSSVLDAENREKKKKQSGGARRP